MYPAEALLQTGHQFRVLVLQPSNDEHAPLACSLQTRTLEDHVPHYTALSYSWGGGSAERVITCNGLPLLINDNLEQALLACRSSKEPLCFWVDQICMNQQDVSEKNYQVPMMDRIFKSARGVIGWLGEPDDSISELAQYAEWILGRPFFDSTPASSLSDERLDFTRRADLDRGRQALIGLLRGRSWFRRSWIVQEAAAQRHNLRLKMGNLTFPYQSLLAVVLFTNDHIQAELKRVPKKTPHPLGWKAYFTPLVFCPAIEMANDSQGRNKLSMLVSHFSSWGATDPRDKIYAFMALAFDAEKYERPDYKLSVETVYRRFASRTMREGLAYTMSYLTFAAQTEPFPGEPSWVANWTTLETNTVSVMRNNTAFRSGGSINDIRGFAFDGRTIRTPGVIKAAIEAVGPAYRPLHEPSESFSMWLARTAKHTRQARQQGSDQTAAADREGEEDSNLRDIANLLVLDGESFLYSSGGAEADHFLRISRPAHGSKVSTERFDTWEQNAQLSRRGRHLPTQPNRYDCLPLTDQARTLIQSRAPRTGIKFHISSGDLVHTYPRIDRADGALDSGAQLGEGLLKYDSRGEGEDEGEEEEKEKDFAEYRDTVQAIALNQKVVVLENGTLGICNWKVRRGDVVAVLVGARLPFVLRPTEETGRYQLISEAYVRGMMFDAVVPERDKDVLQDIVIC